MKRILLLCLCIALFMVGCNNSENTATESQEIVINLPQDDKVNGYRNDDYVNSDKINWSDLTPSEKVDTENLYCGNKNSKKLHKKNCTAVAKIKEENKVFYKSREEYINHGYSICQICNP